MKPEERTIYEKKLQEMRDFAQYFANIGFPNISGKINDFANSFAKLLDAANTENTVN